MGIFHTGYEEKMDKGRGEGLARTMGRKSMGRCHRFKRDGGGKA